MSLNLVFNLWDVVEISGVFRSFLHSRMLICSEFSLPLTLGRARPLLFAPAQVMLENISLDSVRQSLRNESFD